MGWLGEKTSSAIHLPIMSTVRRAMPLGRELVKAIAVVVEPNSEDVPLHMI
jgi:hypothetical protein